MSRPLRIAIAEDERDMREFFHKILPILGHEVVVSAETGTQLVELCRAKRPDLVITDIRMPDMDGIEATRILCQEEPIPVILVTAHHDAETMKRAEMEGIMAYLVKPIKPDDLQPAITLSMRRFEEFQALRREATDLRRALEDRKLIERAKGTVMKRLVVDEAVAYRRLRKLASDRNWKLVDLAQPALRGSVPEPNKARTGLC
jgi:AmiR/NasT family two-component response regulator